MYSPLGPSRKKGQEGMPPCFHHPDDTTISMDLQQQMTFILSAVFIAI